MKTHRTTNHLVKGAAALLALLLSFGSFAAAASAFEPEPFEPPTVPGLDELAVPDICELIDCSPIVPGDDDDDDGEGDGDDEGDDGGNEGDEGDDDEGEEEEEEGEEEEVEVQDETEENIDTPVEATPTFTG